MVKFFLRDGMIYTLGSLMSKGISIFLIPIYTRYLSPLEYGIIDLFIILASIINILITLEITQSIARYYQDISSDFEKAICTSTAFWFTFTSYGVLIFIAYLFRDFLSQIIIGDAGYKNIFMLASFFIMSNGIFYFVYNQLKWQIQSKDSVVVSIINLIISSSLILFLLVIAELKIEAVLIGQTIGNICASMLAIYYAKENYKFVFSFLKLKKLLKFSTPLVLAALSGFFAFYIDRIFIKNMLGLEELGLYGVAYRFASITSIVFSGFQGALMPLVYKHYKENDTPNDISRIFDIFCCFSLIIISGSILFSKEIIIFFTTQTFYESYKLIPILVMVTLFMNMYIFAPGLGIAKKTKLIAFSTLLVTICNIILNFILVPFIGAIGASIATLISSVLLFLLYAIIGSRYYYINYNIKKNLSIFLFVLFIGYFISYIIGQGTIFQIIFKIILFCILSIVLLFLTFNDKYFQRLKFKCVE